MSAEFGSLTAALARIAASPLPARDPTGSKVLGGGRWLQCTSIAYHGRPSAADAAPADAGADKQTSDQSPQAAAAATPSAGVRRTWEMVERTSNRAGRPDGVDILALMTRADHEPHVVLVLNYRPPTDEFVLEFPAGLVDGDETFAATAARELLEETGLTGRVECVHAKALFSDPWKSNETSALVQMTIDGDAPENRAPRQRLGTCFLSRASCLSKVSLGG
jgi:ADP-ribose pyrophosphatase YjhB (NUDIX family)